MYLKYSSGIDGTNYERLRKDSAEGENFIPVFVVNKTPGTIVERLPFQKIDEKRKPIYRSYNNNIFVQIRPGIFYMVLHFFPDMPEALKGKV